MRQSFLGQIGEHLGVPAALSGLGQVIPDRVLPDARQRRPSLRGARLPHRSDIGGRRHRLHFLTGRVGRPSAAAPTATSSIARAGGDARFGLAGHDLRRSPVTFAQAALGPPSSLRDPPRPRGGWRPGHAAAGRSGCVAWAYCTRARRHQAIIVRAEVQVRLVFTDEQESCCASYAARAAMIVALPSPAAPSASSRRSVVRCTWPTTWPAHPRRRPRRPRFHARRGLLHLQRVLRLRRVRQSRCRPSGALAPSVVRDRCSSVTGRSSEEPPRPRSSASAWRCEGDKPELVVQEAHRARLGPHRAVLGPAVTWSGGTTGGDHQGRSRGCGWPDRRQPCSAT